MNTGIILYPENPLDFYSIGAQTYFAIEVCLSIFGLWAPSGTLSPSDFEYTGPVGLVGTSPLCDDMTGLFPIVPVSELSSVDTVRRTPGGLVPVV